MVVLQNVVVPAHVAAAMRRAGLVEDGRDREALSEAAAVALELWSIGVVPDENEPEE